MRKAFLYLHISVFLAGFTGIIGKYITLNEAMLVWYRLLISAATMWILFSLRGRIKKIPVRDIAGLFGIGLLAALHWVSFFGSIKYANVSVALVCFSSVGFFTAILEPVLYRKRINPFDLFLGLLVMLGIFIIFHFDTRYATGIILGVISALLLAFVMIFIRQFAARINTETLLTWQLSGGFLSLSALLPLYLYFFPTTQFLPTTNDWIWLLILSWFCSVIAFQLTTAALRKLSAFTVNLSFNLEPVYGILLAFILFRENKDLNQGFFIGLFLIILSVVLQMARILRNKPQGT
ncbi:MAG: EamA family transporter [Sphingobacteriales bacterium 12-47-4]|nr:MAG: EamA family transporter [Sphingobacteriales bacterium 12-47-4]